ncbi:MAG TPA: copper homeostasis periplasmic binding protein CopC [Croceibacterium sp.]
MNRVLRTFAAGGAAVALAVAGPALAHTRLVGSTPAANATVSSPRTITLTFNERLVPAFSKFELTMPAHDTAIPVETAVSQDGKQIVGTVASPLSKGAYRIAWTAAGADGHKMTGTLAFTVG